jgi:putative inorganic carbon (HCO3(-)) transporter
MTPPAVLFVTLMASTLAFGAVYPWAYWPMAATLAALGLWGWWHGRPAAGPPRALVVALSAVAIAIAVQLVPVPLSVFRRLSPAGDAFLSQFDLAYAYQPPAWHTLSIAPVESLVALGLFIALAVCLTGILDLFSAPVLERFVLSLSLLGLVVAVIGAVNRATMDPKDLNPMIYGFWRPQEGGHPFPPFVNPNHFAGWMVLVAGLSGGYLGGLAQVSWRQRRGDLGAWLLWLTRPEAGRLPLVALCLLAMIVATILTNSRSGAMALGIVILAFAVRVPWTVRGAAGKALALLAIGAAAVGGVVWAGPDQILAKFGRVASDTSAAGRASAWRDAWHLFAEFPIFGSGMGSFGRAMLLDQSGSRSVYFTEAHNDYLQVLAEGGMLVALAAAAVVLVVGVLAWRRLRADRDPLVNWIRFGAVAGLIGIAAQSTVEFSLQMPAVAALSVVLMAIAIHRPSPPIPNAHRM